MFSLAHKLQLPLLRKGWRSASGKPKRRKVVGKFNLGLRQARFHILLEEFSRVQQRDNISLYIKSTGLTRNWVSGHWASQGCVITVFVGEEPALALQQRQSLNKKGLALRTPSLKSPSVSERWEEIYTVLLEPSFSGRETSLAARFPPARLLPSPA